MNKLKSQKEIMLNWKGKFDEPLVTIQCLAYNHQEYIKDAIEGFLLQETNFPFEIIIHDDASTDSTAKIIKDYEKKYSKIINPIYQKENKFQAGKKNEVGDIIYEQTKGKYIALCEGDDYWIDKDKLQIQIDYLKKNKNIDFCFHSSKRFDYLNGNEEKIIGIYANKTSILPFETILTRPHSMIPTASIVYSKEIKGKLIEFTRSNLYLKQADTILQIIAASKGGAIYINKTMSVYRYRVNDSWTHLYNHNYEFQLEVFLSKIKYFISLYSFLGSNNKNLYISLIMEITYKLAILLYDTNHHKKEVITKIFCSIIKKQLLVLGLDSSNLVLYGASSFTKWFVNNITNVNIECILDSNINKHNTQFCSYNIIHPSKMKNNVIPVLITLFGRESQISLDLQKEYKFKKEQIVIINDCNIDDFNLILDVLENNKTEK